MKRVTSAIICICLALSLLSGCGREDGLRLSAEYLANRAGSAGTGSAGGEWTVFALERSGYLPEGWREDYFAALEAALEENLKKDGEEYIRIKNTEYSRAILALRALGGDPRLFAGFELTGFLEDIEKTSSQGAAGIAYALLALGEDAGTLLAGSYLEKLLEYRLADGGFSPSPDAEADADLTAIALQAMAALRGRFGLETEIASALDALSAMQNGDGSFSNGGAPTAESTAQAVIALCGLGLDPREDSRFKKDKNVFDALMDFYCAGGGFAHVRGGKADIIATEQAVCALAAVQRLERGEAFIYDFSRRETSLSCALSVRCDELLENLDLLDKSKRGLVPADGLLYENGQAVFSEGESAFDLLKRELKNSGLHFEFTATPITGGAYIEGIANLYEFDCGALSGWFYSVNGAYPAKSSSEYALKDGDEVVFEYVCSMREVSQ